MAQYIRSTFSQAAASQRSVFIAYITSGYPTQDDTVPLLLSFEAAGVDLIELGIAHSDPIADGPTIQLSSNLALQGGITIEKSLQFVAEARKQGLKIPIIFMGYYNPFYIYGEEKIVHDAKAVGVNGFLVVDLPSEEESKLKSECLASGLGFIPLIAPTTSLARLSRINDTVANSFIYAVSLLGVTGKRTDLSEELPDFVSRIKNRIRDWPIAVGFGISTRDQVAKVTELGADGIVVGSAIIDAIQSILPELSHDRTRLYEGVKDFIRGLLKDSSTTRTQQPKPTEQQEQSTKLQEKEHKMGHFFGQFGGRFAPETLSAALDELEAMYMKLRDDPTFREEIQTFNTYIGRPTPLYFAKRLTQHVGNGVNIWLKREDLAHTGAHKINNAVGQALLALRLGKKRIIAETGAGQHGVATATICAKLGLECVVYMGHEDCLRQSLNVFRMKMLGATVVPVLSGSKTLKDAINEAMRDWVRNLRTTHYLVGSAIGPSPFPTIVRDFQSIIGKEAREQSQLSIGKLPDTVVACVGGGSNAIGIFHPFLNDVGVKLIGVEAGGKGIHTHEHSATLVAGNLGILHGTKTFLLQDSQGQISNTHSISAGLDYPGVGPEHAWLKDSNRAQYVAVDDDQALEGFKLMARLEGIIPALETSHAIYYALEYAKTLQSGQNVLINMSGRGDKDMGTVAKVLKVTID